MLYCLIFAVSLLAEEQGGCLVSSCDQIPAVWKSSTSEARKLFILWAVQMCIKKKKKAYSKGREKNLQTALAADLELDHCP